MSSDKNKHLIGLSHFIKFGPVRLSLLKKHFGSFEKAFLAEQKSLARTLGDDLAAEFVSFRSGVEFDKILDDLDKEEISVASVEDDVYPHLLKEIFNPPQILFYKGDLRPDELCLAVVGSRNYSSYGKQIIERMIRRISSAGPVIASGLALGVDSHAHRVCLEEGGKTIAVLGGGVDNKSIYPSSNISLAKKIVEKGGVVMSEFPPGTPPLKHHFPQRNRIVSGISKASLVVEAREKSGALITARYALEQNREVLAVPGSIYSALSAGPNKLICEGAKAVLSPEDIFDSLDLTETSDYINTEEKKLSDPKEMLVYESIKEDPVHIDELARRTGLQIGELNSVLSMMEIEAKIKNIGGMNYIKTK